MQHLTMVRIGVPRLFDRSSEEEKQAKAAHVYVTRDGRGKVISCR